MLHTDSIQFVLFFMRFSSFDLIWIRVRVLGFGVWGLGSGVGGWGFEVWGFDSLDSGKGLGFRVWGLEFRV